MNLTRTEKFTVIALARNRILRHLGLPGDGMAGESSLPSSLREPGGAFVSLYAGQKLKGCIGTFSERNPLYRNVEEMAFSAAFCDPRFAPVDREDVPGLRIEVSILTPRVPVQDPAEIEMGRHGIYMQKGSQKGTLLPQVAVKQQWSREEFLGHCSRDKAGLGWNGWKSAELFIYEAVVVDSDEIS